MSATVFGNKIYVSHDLHDRLTEREYRVLLAHEIGHFMARDRAKIIFMMLTLTSIITGLFYFGQFVGAVMMMILFKPAVEFYQRHVELNADRFALRKTRDFDSFISLMDKLEHNGRTHPGKAERVQLAKDMRDKL